MVVALYTGIVFHSWVAILFPWQLFLVSQSMGWMKLPWWLLHLMAHSDVISKGSKNIQSRFISSSCHFANSLMPNTFIPFTFVATRQPFIAPENGTKVQVGWTCPLASQITKPCKTRKARRAGSQDKRQKVALLLAWEKFQACTGWAACACQKESRSCLRFASA